MTPTPLVLSGVFLLKPHVHQDERGYFLESFRQSTLEEAIGYPILFCQDNESRSTRGVLRGLHFQKPPYAQAKLIRVIQGEVLDVVVDLRVSSPTFGQHVAVYLNDRNKHQLFIPIGCAHGFVVLSDSAITCYKTDAYYRPEAEGGVAFDDPSLGIDWLLPRTELTISCKDLQQPTLNALPPIFC